MIVADGADLIWASANGQVAVGLVLVDAGRVRARVYTRAGVADMAISDAVELFRALAPPEFTERASAAATDVMAGSGPDGADRPGQTL